MFDPYAIFGCDDELEYREWRPDPFGGAVLGGFAGGAAGALCGYEIGECIADEPLGLVGAVAGGVTGVAVGTIAGATIGLFGGLDDLLEEW